MYCAQCGTRNAEGDQFCKNCGAPLGLPPAVAASASSQRANEMPVAPIRAKVPLIAAILNLFFGIGYFYMGYKKVLGLQTAIFMVLVFVLYLVGFYFTFGLLTIGIAILLAIDGFQKADGDKGIFSAE